MDGIAEGTRLRTSSPPATAEAAAPNPHQELERLALRLEDRESVVHLAWAFGLACVAFVMGGVAIKLFRDSAAVPRLAYVLAAAAALEVVTGAWRLLRGLQLHRGELADFQRMQALRVQLGVDRPRLPAA
jgi:heme A synthase